MPNQFLRILKSPRLWQLALVSYWLALFVGTHLPIERIPISGGTVDKVAHIAAFAGLTAILATTWRLSTGRFTISSAIGVWLVVALYGAIEEITQPLVGRTASIWDWLADMSGAAIGLVVFAATIGRWLGNAPTSPAESHHRQWVRFSLRTLFVLMTLVAIACYWLMLPTLNAQRFAQAIHKRDYARAERLFIADSEIFPGRMKEHQRFKCWARIAPLKLTDLWQGERHIGVAIRYGDGGGMATSAADIRAYRSGLKLEMLVP